MEYAVDFDELATALLSQETEKKKKLSSKELREIALQKDAETWAAQAEDEITRIMEVFS